MMGWIRLREALVNSSGERGGISMDGGNRIPSTMTTRERQVVVKRNDGEMGRRRVFDTFVAISGHEAGTGSWRNLRMMFIYP